MREKFYTQIYSIRLFEETLEKLFAKGELFGTVHSCIGQEAAAVGVTGALTKNDIVVSNHRGHGHFIAFCDDIEGLAAELMGKESGICAGRGGSQHLNKGNFYSNGITAGMIPVATGMAFAEKNKQSNNIVAAFLGDGALGEGIVYESLNMASLWKLPIIYVVENNYYAMSTHISSAIAGGFSSRANAFSVDSKELTTNDVEVIYSEFSRIADDIRKNPKPFFFVINTYRYCGHSKSDDCAYRNKTEESRWKKRDPLILLGERLEKATREDIHKRCWERINAAFKKAEEAHFPDKSGLLEGLFQ